MSIFGLELSLTSRGKLRAACNFAVLFVTTLAICNHPQGKSLGDMVFTEQPLAKSLENSGPYCGIRSLYLCLKAIGADVRFEDLVSNDCVGSSAGSTPSQLAQCVKKYSVEAVFASNLAVSDLLYAKVPMVLHVNSGRIDNVFDHWIAFLGVEKNQFIVVDGVKKKSISPAELLSIWDGSALLISKNNQAKHILVEGKVETAILLALVFIVVLAADKVHAKFLRNSSHFVGVALLVSASAVLALIAHCDPSSGFVANTSTMLRVVHQHENHVFEKITREQLIKGDYVSTAILVDARKSNDFELGSLPNAMNLPVDLDSDDRRQLLRDFDKATKVVVFCQSDKCAYADETAKFLRLEGFRDILVYSGGFRDWESK